MIVEGIDSVATLARSAAATNAALLRGPGDAGTGQGAAQFGPLEVLLALGLVILLVIYSWASALAGAPDPSEMMLPESIKSVRQASLAKANSSRLAARSSRKEDWAHS